MKRIGADYLTHRAFRMGEPKQNPTLTEDLGLSKSVKIRFDKLWLADEADVEGYLEAMGEALLEDISKGKRIQI